MQQAGKHVHQTDSETNKHTVSSWRSTDKKNKKNKKIKTNKQTKQVKICIEYENGSDVGLKTFFEEITSILCKHDFFCYLC